MKKRVFSMVIMAAMVLSVVSCGGSGGSESVNWDNIEEKLENMSDDELEQAVIDGANKLEDEIEKEQVVTDSEDTEKEDEVENFLNAPVDEILNADFSSLKVQFNNDVFQHGGYMTVGEFVEKYGDRYEVRYMGKLYDECGDYLIEQSIRINEPKFFNCDIRDHWINKYSIAMIPKYGEKQKSGLAGNVHRITAYISNITSSEEKIPLSDAHIICFYNDKSTVAWTAAGLDTSYINGTFGCEEHISTNADYTPEKFVELLENQGFTRIENDNFRAENTICYSTPQITGLDMDMKYLESEDKSVCCFCVAGEANATGAKPMFSYIVFFNPDTNKMKDLVISRFIGLFTE